MSTQTTDILIIGSGFAGIGMAIRLKQAGFTDLTLLEKADGVGGVWRDNTYPGAACDVPSHLYSFSFARHHDWSRRFAPQSEILAYLRTCSRQFDIDPHIRFGHEVSEARFDDASGRWQVTCRNGASFNSRILITATGQLSRPAIPALPGLDSFRGHQFHSARWDHDYDLQGKRVAVVGTGASAIQFVPEVARQADKLYLFQRSAPYVVHKADREWSPRQRRLMQKLPLLQDIDRLYTYLLFETRVFGFAFMNAFLKFYEWSFRLQLRRQVKDPELRRKLQPDYPMGCKRILLANNYYPALIRDNVEVIDHPIDAVGSDRVIDSRGREYPVDTLIWGTGFAATEFLSPISITGRNGLELNRAWQDGAHAYKGISVAGFPNMFMLYGPNTNLGHSSIIHMLESQFHYVQRCLTLLGENDLAWMDVRQEAEQDFNQRLQKRLGRSVWAGDCESWYKNEAGINTNNWSGFTLTYRAITRHVAEDDYEFAAH